MIELAYNNSYHSSIQMAPFKAFYGRRYRSPISWSEVSETIVIGPNLVFDVLERVQLLERDIGLLRADRSPMQMFVERILSLRSMTMSIFRSLP